MGRIKLLLNFLACFALARADIDNSGLQAKVDTMSNKVGQLEKFISELQTKESELEAKNSGLETMLSVLRTKYADEAPLMFDCYLTETLTTSGPIKFNGCSGNTVHIIWELTNVLFISDITKLFPPPL